MNTPPQHTGDVLRLEHIDKQFPTAAGALSVLRGVTLTVRPGEFVVVTGPSGSGKTTLLSLAGLLEPPSAGTIWFDGRCVAGAAGPSPAGDRALRELRARDIGMVFQRFHLLPHRSVLENVLFRFRYLPHDRAAARRASQARLDAFGLGPAADRPVRVLSAGEMQRVAIARAVVRPPRLLLADEPTGNLDRESAAAVMDCFRQLNHSGMTVLMTTHNETWLALATRHLRCRNGTLEEAP
ncbi:MAG: ABC transporter ATP-binding protein [Lentisphaerae bacterium]|nr:ABC transporter ATP-binding protein [Lentisphaerota bacterium]